MNPDFLAQRPDLSAPHQTDPSLLDSFGEDRLRNLALSLRRNTLEVGVSRHAIRETLEEIAKYRPEKQEEFYAENSEYLKLAWPLFFAEYKLQVGRMGRDPLRHATALSLGCALAQTGSHSEVEELLCAETSGAFKNDEAKRLLLAAAQHYKLVCRTQKDFELDDLQRLDVFDETVKFAAIEPELFGLICHLREWTSEFSFRLPQVQEWACALAAAVDLESAVSWMPEYVASLLSDKELTYELLADAFALGSLANAFVLCQVYNGSQKGQSKASVDKDLQLFQEFADRWMHHRGRGMEHAQVRKELAMLKEHKLLPTESVLFRLRTFPNDSGLIPDILRRFGSDDDSYGAFFCDQLYRVLTRAETFKKLRSAALSQASDEELKNHYLRCVIDAYLSSGYRGASVEHLREIFEGDRGNALGIKLSLQQLRRDNHRFLLNPQSSSESFPRVSSRVLDLIRPVEGEVGYYSVVRQPSWIQDLDHLNAYKLQCEPFSFSLGPCSFAPTARFDADLFDSLGGLFDTATPVVDDTQFSKLMKRVCNREGIDIASRRKLIHGLLLRAHLLDPELAMRLRNSEEAHVRSKGLFDAEEKLQIDLLDALKELSMAYHSEVITTRAFLDHVQAATGSQDSARNRALFLESCLSLVVGEELSLIRSEQSQIVYEHSKANMDLRVYHSKAFPLQFAHFSVDICADEGYQVWQSPSMFPLFFVDRSKGKVVMVLYFHQFNDPNGNSCLLARFQPSDPFLTRIDLDFLSRSLIALAHSIAQKNGFELSIPPAGGEKGYLTNRVRFEPYLARFHGEEILFPSDRPLVLGGEFQLKSVFRCRQNPS